MIEAINPQTRKKHEWCYCDAVKCDGSAHMHFENGEVECADGETELTEKYCKPKWHV